MAASLFRVSQSSSPGLGSPSNGRLPQGLWESPRHLEHNTRALAYWFTAAVSNAQEASIGVLIYQGAAVPPQRSYKALAQDVLSIYVYPLFNNITPDSEPLVSHRVWGTEEQHTSAVFPFLCCFPVAGLFHSSRLGSIVSVWLTHGAGLFPPDVCAFPLPCTQSLRSGSDNSLGIHSTLLSSPYPEM